MSALFVYTILQVYSVGRFLTLLVLDRSRPKNPQECDSVSM